MKEELQQQIEAYLAGELSQAEAAAFETQIAKDKALASEVTLYRQMDDLLGESDVMDFSTTLESVMDSNVRDVTKQEAVIKKIPQKPTTIRRWLSLAAGFALVAVLGTVIYTNLNQPSPDSLYQANMKFPVALGGGSTLRSVEEQAINPSQLAQITTSWQTANEAYQQEQYEIALQALTKIATIDPNFEVENRGDYFFKKGLLQLKLGQIEAAITSFKAVTTGDYVSNATWKRALALLKVDEDKAKTALEAIVNTNHSERAAARKILEAL